MTMPQVLPSKPTHLHEVRWWQLTWNGDRCYIRQRRAIFYLKRVEWNDHPWGKNDRGGAFFENQWTLESKDRKGQWRPDGRSADGWDKLPFGPLDFATFDDARDAAIAGLATREAARAKNLEEIREAIAALRAESPNV